MTRTTLWALEVTLVRNRASVFLCRETWWLLLPTTSEKPLRYCFHQKRQRAQSPFLKFEFLKVLVHFLFCFVVSLSIARTVLVYGAWTSCACCREFCLKTEAIAIHAWMSYGGKRLQLWKCQEPPSYCPLHHDALKLFNTCSDALNAYCPTLPTTGTMCMWVSLSRATLSHSS